MKQKFVVKAFSSDGVLYYQGYDTYGANLRDAHMFETYGQAEERIKGLLSVSFYGDTIFQIEKLFVK